MTCFPAFAAITMEVRHMVDRSSTDTEEDILERLDDQGLYNKEERIQMIKDAATEIRRLRGVAQTPKCARCGSSGDTYVLCSGCGAPAQAAPEPEIDRLRRALELLTEEPPEEMHTIDEPDEDWEVIVKMRAIAREALSPSHRGSPE